MTEPFQALEGGCTCRAVRYRMTSPPLFVHCCHCRWCQRESGSAFALNAMIEADRVTNLREAPELVHTPSNSERSYSTTNHSSFHPQKLFDRWAGCCL